jgi:outer membrane protein, heavy metal efflux system
MLRVLLCAYVAFFATARAQQSLDLKAAVALALDRHPLLAAGSARILSAEGLRMQAALRPNPVAVLQMENWRFRGAPEFVPSRDVDYFAFASQRIETAAKRRLRTELAEAATRRSELERELTAKQIVNRVKFTYWGAMGAQRVHDLLLENVETFDQIVRYHEIRVQEGAMAEFDLLKVRLERERVAIASMAADLDAQRARIELYRAMGETDFPVVRLTDSLEPVAPLPRAGEEDALANRTEVKLALQGVDQSRAALRLQQALGRQDIEVMGGFKRTMGWNTTMGSLQMPIPFFNRNQGNVASAVAEIRAAEADAAAMRAVVLAELRAAVAEVQNRRRQLTDFFPGVLKQANESSRISLAAYREGGSDLLRLLDTERVRIEAQVMYYRTLAEYRQSLATLDAALGVAP